MSAKTPERRLLVTVSGDATALWGARFVGGFLARGKALRLTLFHMAPRPSVPGAPDSERQAELRQREAGLREEGETALAQAADVLAGLGVPRECLETRVSFPPGLKIEELLVEADRGGYDAVVLGRRGLAWYEELFAHSLTRDMLRLSVATPVWVCREPEPGRSGVLLCVDGSEPSLRMAGHVGRMVANQDQHAVTILRVLRRKAAALKSPTEIITECHAQLAARGVPEARIREKAVPSENVAEAILREAAEGGYAAVAVGRTGVGRGYLGDILAGSVSLVLLRDLKGAALWVCR